MKINSLIHDCLRHREAIKTTELIAQDTIKSFIEWIESIIKSQNVNSSFETPIVKAYMTEICKIIRSMYINVCRDFSDSFRLCSMIIFVIQFYRYCFNHLIHPEFDILSYMFEQKYTTKNDICYNYIILL